MLVRHRGHECYTAGMPTTRPRHVVTESDEIAEVLDQAAKRWPTLSRGQLLRRLVLEAGRQQQGWLRSDQQRIRAALADPDRALAGIGDSQAVRRSRDREWPD